LAQKKGENFKAVTITAKSGKTGGAITNICYEGTGGTNYAKTTTPPTTATGGTYAVTFDVAASAGWKAASGLIAGTLKIFNENYNIFNSISNLATFLSSQTGNTKTTPYYIALDMNTLGGGAGTSGSVGAVLLANSNKYVYLDLSGSTITGIPYEAFFDYGISCTTLVGITIPNSVTYIGYEAFY